MQIHHDIYVNVEFFKTKEKNFIVWVGPLLKRFNVEEQEYIYKEGDDVKESNLYSQLNDIVYFLIKGVAGYVLPRFNNMVYITIERGDHFGIIDIVYDSEKIDMKTSMQRRSNKSKELFRRFTIQALI